MLGGAPEIDSVIAYTARERVRPLLPGTGRRRSGRCLVEARAAPALTTLV